MNRWTRLGLATAISGTTASFVSTAALAILARAEGKGALQPTNATSHWIHGEDAARQHRLDAAHTLVGFGTHHASALFWALPLEIWLSGRRDRSAKVLAGSALAISAVAAAVDYGLAPRRLTPGWEDVLSKRSIAAAYGALALGLAAGAAASSRI